MLELNKLVDDICERQRMTYVEDVAVTLVAQVLSQLTALFEAVEASLLGQGFEPLFDAVASSSESSHICLAIPASNSSWFSF